MATLDPGSSRNGPARGSAPIGAVLLVALAVLLAGGVAATTMDAAPEPATPPTAAFELTAEDDRLALVHRGGEPVDVRALDVRVRVDGEPLSRQPPVPFFSADGFRPGPTGPFNAASDPTWTAGESASLRVAATNDPTLDEGARVELRLRVDGHGVATLETRVA